MDAQQFIFRADKKMRLADFDPGSTGDFADEEAAQASMRAESERLAKYQDLLMAHESNGLLVLFQAVDGAGKDATIKHVMASVDPQGCEVKMFKSPTPKEEKHDYLWRTVQALPARGQIGIFNRSYYEHVVAERVHPEKLEAQQMAEEVGGESIWAQRFRHINNFEDYLLDNRIHVLKFFLNLSKEAQRRRLLERIEREDKRWKFSMTDIEERGFWDPYMEAYEEAFRHTSREHAPWYIIPADHRWYARATVASIIAEKLASLHTEYPTLSEESEKELQAGKEQLESEAP